MQTNLTLMCVASWKRNLGEIFTIFTNLSNCKPRMYADDTHLTYAGSNLENVQFCLNEDLANVFNWLQANKLTLNMTKTEFMLIGSRQRLNTLTASPTITMNNTQVSQVTATKSLGVIIDDKPDWHSHVEKLTKKIASGIGALQLHNL